MQCIYYCKYFELQYVISNALFVFVDVASVQDQVLFSVISFAQCLCLCPFGYIEFYFPIFLRWVFISSLNVQFVRLAVVSVQEWMIVLCAFCLCSFPLSVSSTFYSKPIFCLIGISFLSVRLCLCCGSLCTTDPIVQYEAKETRHSLAHRCK